MTSSMGRNYVQPAIVFCGRHAREWSRARDEGAAELQSTIDLGRTTERVRLLPEGVLPTSSHHIIPWDDIEQAARNEHACFRWTHETGLEKLQVFSETTCRFCSLYATSGAPTILVAGFPMHRIEGIDPWKDTRHKVRALRPVRGRVLDTCMGLGYTAIQLADAGAQEVVTVELDPAVEELASKNPWSEPLFNLPTICRVRGDVAEVISELADASFHQILHDPPTIELAGELYGRNFYRELHRVLKPGGRLFHYIGDPDSRHGRSLFPGVIRRLQEAGFRTARIVRPAHGVVAVK